MCIQVPKLLKMLSLSFTTIQTMLVMELDWFKINHNGRQNRKIVIYSQCYLQFAGFKIWWRRFFSNTQTTHVSKIDEVA
jgi:hypothetical protein